MSFYYKVSPALPIGDNGFSYKSHSNNVAIHFKVIKTTANISICYTTIRDTKRVIKLLQHLYGNRDYRLSRVHLNYIKKIIGVPMTPVPVTSSTSVVRTVARPEPNAIQTLKDYSLSELSSAFLSRVGLNISAWIIKKLPRQMS